MGSIPVSRELGFRIIEELKIQAWLQTLIQNHLCTKKFPNRNKAVSQMLEDFEGMATQSCLLFLLLWSFWKKESKRNEGIKMVRDIPPPNWLLSRHHHSETGSSRVRHIVLLFPLASSEPKLAVEEEADLFFYPCESTKMKGTELPWQILNVLPQLMFKANVFVYIPTMRFVWIYWEA